MQAAGFRKWIGRVSQLDRRQREQLLAILRPAVVLDRVCATIAQSLPTPICPGCGSGRRHRHGVDRGIQRYRCCACGRSFSALTGTPLARLRHRSKWLDDLDKMLEGRPARAAADAVEVHRNTSFRWRHRFLHLLKHDRPASLGGTAEADELFLLESQKGSRKLDRQFARQAGISHQAVNLGAGERTRSALHVQNVNAYHRRFRQWLARFNGLASRYLPNYLGWQWAVDGRRIDTPERMLRAALGVPTSRRFNSEQ